MAETMRGFADMMGSAAKMMGGVANTMHSAANTLRSSANTTAPPIWKNKLTLNQYLGIFMQFKSIFLFYLKKVLFHTHQPINLENSRFFLKLKNLG